MSSRKDYVRIADILAGELALAEHDGDKVRSRTVKNIARSIADVFAQDNPRFDRERFYRAVTPDYWAD